MKVGQQVSFTVPAYPGPNFQGSNSAYLTRIGPNYADDACGTRRSESRCEGFTG